MTLPAEVQDWMTRFADCVRARDYAAGEALFSRTVDSFGTVADRAEGLETLVERQWREVWDVTEGFDFEYEAARAWSAGDLRCVVAKWFSRGLPDSMMPTERTGRATLLLKEGADGWQAVHTHFSIDPDVTQQTDEP